MTQTVPLPVEGARVRLRPLRADDLAAFQHYRRDAELGRYQGWRPQTDAEATAFIDAMAETPVFPDGEWVQLAIAERTGDVLIGDVGVCVAIDGSTAEIGFTLAREAQGQGLATEAIRLLWAVLAAHTPVGEIHALTDARNTASIALLERLGMRRVTTRAAVFRGEACTEHLYTLRLHDPA